MVLRNWELPKRKRRTVVMISNEESIDASLKCLKKKRFINAGLYRGVDVSDDAISEWKESQNGGTDEGYFRQVVKKTVERAPDNSLICLDDFQDSKLYRMKNGDGLQKLLDFYLRCGRHKRKSTVALNHLIASGYMGRQLSNSVKGRVLFPRSSRHKIQSWFNTHLGMPLAASKKILARVAPHSRWLYVNLHTPTCIISEKYCALI
jgi:hypothetical protein